jgi:hypothetical protein
MENHVLNENCKFKDREKIVKEMVLHDTEGEYLRY